LSELHILLRLGEPSSDWKWNQNKIFQTRNELNYSNKVFNIPEAKYSFLCLYILVNMKKEKSSKSFTRCILSFLFFPENITNYSRILNSFSHDVIQGKQFSINYKTVFYISFVKVLWVFKSHTYIDAVIECPDCKWHQE